MNITQQKKIVDNTRCELHFDNLTRQLYATDASIYRIEPVGVAFPRNDREAANVIQVAIDNGLSIIPRGAGTGLVGGAIGEGLIVDFARYNKKILDIDLDARSVRVQAGVVLDQLNEALKPYKYCFGPDVATSSRATLGGMINNNSSGARAPIYGTTADHIISLKLILADGRIIDTRADQNLLVEFNKSLDAWIFAHSVAIREQLPPILVKRWHGYGMDRYLQHPGDICKIIAGSEGTLVGIWEALLNISPLPTQKGLAVIAFDSIMDAMQATVSLLDLKPAAIEHMDRLLFDQTRGQIAFKAGRDFLQLDSNSWESLLLVEFYDNVEDKLAALAKRNIGRRTLICSDEREMSFVWEIRKAGLTLLTACIGSDKPIEGIEDVAVRPEQLPDYVKSLQQLMRSLDTGCSFYGHAASGVLHVRPVIDLHNVEGRRKFRKIADEVSTLVAQFKGSISSEHGLGIARTEYLARHIGPDLMQLSRDIKHLFDPRQAMNPGKIIDNGNYKIDGHLRVEREIRMNFSPILAFASKDKSFIGNLEQCNGNGVCLKSTPTMCPTYRATGDELMSTRGRSNIIRSMLQGYSETSDPLCSASARGQYPLLASDLDLALSNCLSCKACKTECPSNVDMALLKAELIHAKHQRYGMPWRDWILSRVDLLASAGSRFAYFANFALRRLLVRKAIEKFLGITSQRSLPFYATQPSVPSLRFGASPFHRWFQQRQTRNAPPVNRGSVILWDDTFVRYYEPHVGKAATFVLEQAGYRVKLLAEHKCCGRPAFSMGDLKRVTRLGQKNLELLRSTTEPIIFLEPSCYAMFVEDYRELNLPLAEEIARRCFLFEHFIGNVLTQDPNALPFQPRDWQIAMHVHCHVKACTDTAMISQAIKTIPKANFRMLNTGCCGMAGSFGMMRSKYDLSLQVAQPLVQQIQQLEPQTKLIACGFSCRQQISHLTTVHPLHIAQVLEQAIVLKM